jgi:transposase
MTGRERGASVSLTVGSNEPRPADAPRRSFTIEQKRAILAEAARCTQPGDIGALLRKHRIYSSTLSKWRKSLESGAMLRGPGRPPKRDDKDKELAELRRRVSQLEARATRAENLVAFQKKAFSLLDEAATLVTGS